MNSDQALRRQLVFALTAEQAHAGFDTVLSDFPRELRGRKTQGMPYSPWELLEHMRIAQWDILEFSRDPKHVSPEFPSGYWPSSPEPADDNAWNESVAAFQRDLNALVELTSSADLFAPLPHSPDKNVLREVLIAIDHNSYHLGQLMMGRKMLGASE